MDDDHDVVPGEPAGRSVVSPLVLLAVLGSVTAGCIQIALGEAVPEQTAVRGLSWGEGVAQVLVGTALLVFASRRTAIWTVIVNCFAIATWSITSVVGIGFLEGYEEAAGPVLADWVATIAAALAGFAAVFAIKPARASQLGRSDRSYIPAIGLTIVAIVAAVLAVSTIDRTDDVDVVAGGGGPTTSAPSAGSTTSVAPSTSTTLAPTSTAPSTTVGGDSSDAWRLGATDQEIAEAESLVGRTHDQLRDLTVDDAIAQGYVPFTKRNLVRRDHLADDVVLDPTAIEVLMVEEVDGEERIVGATYVLDRYATAVDIPRFAGPLLSWDLSGSGCLAADGAILGLDQGSCASGTVEVKIPPRLRIWLEPIATSSGALRSAATCGVYVYLELPDDADVPGCS